MDRLDIWMNAQRGWRREILRWLYIGPLTAMMTAATWSMFGWRASAAAGCVTIAVLLIGGLLPARQRRKKWTPPLFSWRRMAATLLISAGQVSNVAFWQPGTAGWRHWHQVHDITELLAIACFLALVIAEARYTSRLSRQAVAREQSCAPS